MSRYLHKVEIVLKKKLSVSQQNSVDALDEVVGKISIDESLLDLFGAIRDVDLLYNPNSIFYNFLILPVKLCEKLMANNEKENDFLLSTSCICLAKFMSVSERYCRQNLPLFIQLMTNCKDSKVRSNLVVSFGDFCTSYNHLVVGCSNERISKYLVLCLIILNQATLNGAAEQRILSKIIEHWDTAFQDKIAEKYDNDTNQIIEDNEIKDLLNELISKAKKSESSHKLACQLENILNGNRMEIDSNTTNNDNLSENSKVVVKKGKKQPLPNENDPNFAQRDAL